MTQSSQTTTQNSSFDPGRVRVATHQDILTPSPESNEAMAIRFVDWKMIERRLTAAMEPPKDYSNLCSALFGIGVSAFLYLIPLALTKDMRTWVLWAYGAFAATFSLCGIFTFFLGRDNRKIRRTMITGILDDVREIESRYTTAPAMQGGQPVIT